MTKKFIMPLDEIELNDGEILMVLGGFGNSTNANNGCDCGCGQEGNNGCNCGCGCEAGSKNGCHCGCGTTESPNH